MQKGKKSVRRGKKIVKIKLIAFDLVISFIIFLVNGNLVIFIILIICETKCPPTTVSSFQLLLLVIHSFPVPSCIGGGS